MNCKKCGEKNIINRVSSEFCRRCYYKDYYQKNSKKCINSQKEYNKTEKGKKTIEKNKENRNKITYNIQKTKIFDEVLNCVITKHTIYIRRARLKKMGTTEKEFIKKIKKQNYCCALCGIRFENKKTNYPNQDHCHKTKRIRGILCSKCNLSLGFVNEDISHLKKMIRYLEKFK